MHVRTQIEPASHCDDSPPKDDPISVDELKQFDGSDESKPVYVAVKGDVFDVSPKREMYGECKQPCDSKWKAFPLLTICPTWYPVICWRGIVQHPVRATTFLQAKTARVV